jgi:hypothetical protein
LFVIPAPCLTAGRKAGIYIIVMLNLPARQCQALAGGIQHLIDKIPKSVEARSGSARQVRDDCVGLLIKRGMIIL